MASKVLVPASPFAKLQVKKSPSESSTSGFIISGGDASARVAHLEHSVRFLQEQHRLMLSGLHAEIEALRERNRDLQFQLIFNKESSPKTSSPANEETAENIQEANLKREVCRLEREAAAARGEARAAEARALQLQRLVDAQAEKLRELDVRSCCSCRSAAGGADAGTVSGVEASAEAEERGSLRARLADAERLVRRLRADADRQRREVLAAAAGGAVTNLLFDDAAARHAHLQCMKNSLHASLRASGLDAYGYQNTYHFPPVHTPEFWREPLREEYSSAAAGAGRGARRRPLTLPELSAAGHHIHRSTVYANNHTRVRANGYENKNKKALNGDTANTKSPDEPATEDPQLLYHATDLSKTPSRTITDPNSKYPELKIVVTRIIPHEKVSNGQVAESNRARPRRHHHRKQAATDHT